MPLNIVREDINRLNVDATVLICEADNEACYGEVRIADSTDDKHKKILFVKCPPKDGGTAYFRTLLSGYSNSLSLAAEDGCESIAFSLDLGDTGDYSDNERIDATVSVFSGFLEQNDMDIYLSLPYQKSSGSLSQYHDSLEHYIRDNYIPWRPIDYCYGISESDSGSMAPKADMAPAASFMSTAAVPELQRKEKGTFKNAGRPDLFSLKRNRREKEESTVIYQEDTKAPTENHTESFETIVSIVRASRSLDELLDTREKTFMDMVFYYADMRGMTDVEVRKRANLDKKTFSKLRCGNTKCPSRTTALALAIALRLSLDETKDLLARAGMALSPCNRIDVIVKYFIENEVYDIYAINLALFEHGEMLLGSQAAD